MDIVHCEKRDEWNGFISGRHECPILQSFEWPEVKNWEPIRLAVLDKGKIAAAVSILKRKIPYLSKSIFYAPNGPVLDFKNEELLKKLLEGIRIEAQKHKAIVFKMDPILFEDDAEAIRILKENGFKSNKKQVQPRSTFYLDLTQSEDQILKNCEEKTRYNIRLSAKKGVVVAEKSDNEGLMTFYKLYQETSQRDNFLIHPLGYYKRIKTNLVDRGMAKIFIAYLSDMPIASVFIFMFGRRVWYMYGASLSKHREVMPNHVLHWEIIKWAKGAGYEIYDLWGIPSNLNPKHPLWGVYRFKKGFNGKLVKYVGMQDLVYDPLFYNLFEKGLDFYKNMRSLITKGKISDSLEE